MYPVSPQFLAAVMSNSQRVVVSAELLYENQVVIALPIEDGTVTADSRREVLRDLSLTIVAPAGMSIEELEALVSKVGSEVRVKRGLRLAGADELVPLGVFVVEDVDAGGKTITITGNDRSSMISRARWTDPYQVLKDTNVLAAAIELLQDRWPAVEIGFTAAQTSATVGQNVVFQPGADTDPWKDCRELVASIGLDLYFDGEGTVRVRPIPDAGISPVTIEYPAGTMTIADSDKRRTTFEKTYNGVIAQGEGSDLDVPVRGEAWDEDPDSPTRIGGPYGKRPLFYSSPLLTTAEQCQAAARTRLAGITGVARQASWEQIVNPAHEPGDVVSRAGELHLLDSFPIPLLASGTMTASTRETGGEQT